MASRAQPGAESAASLGLPERYRIRRRIAIGGMASVWCADDLALARPVAIKLLSARFATDDVAVRRFKREARAAARVSTHPHVVSIYDVGDLEVGEDGPSPSPPAFIVMEYLGGGTVADAIRAGTVGRRESLRWLREAASALDHAQTRGIVHRDIKPANFLLDQARVLHVADFGIARLVSEDTITMAGELFGTAAYLSPEQALGREATGASDRYALAVAAFELLAGERPFAAEHFAAQARQHIEAERPSASERNRTLPPAVDDVLRRGMAVEPDARHETAGAFVDGLEAVLAGGPAAGGAGAGASVRASDRPTDRLTVRPNHRPVTRPAARPPGRQSAGPAGSGRRGGRVIALAALLVAALGVGAVALAGAGGSGPSPSRVIHASTRIATAPVRRRHRRPPVTASTSTTTSSATTAAPPTADQLQATGHREMLAGSYPAAITSLRQAVSTADPVSLTYAYALYDLGRSLLLAGDPAAAVSVLQQRMKIPDQIDVVRQLLDQARRASGQAPAPLTPSRPGQATGRGGSDAPGQGNGANASGGAGLAPSPGRSRAKRHAKVHAKEHAGFIAQASRGRSHA